MSTELRKFADSSNGRVHVADYDLEFSQGARPWEFGMLCGASVTGVFVKLQSVNCKECRKKLEALKETSA